MITANELLQQTCRCLSKGYAKRGWTYDEARNLWVCSNCMLPANYVIQMCPWCGEDFIPPIWNDDLGDYQKHDCVT